MQKAYPKTYRLEVTEFWKATYRIWAHDVEHALALFASLGADDALSVPDRTRVGEILPPERVRDMRGKLLYENRPPADDAEKMLFLEMWRRMRSGEDPLRVSMEFICEAKGWNLSEIRALPWNQEVSGG